MCVCVNPRSVELSKNRKRDEEVVLLVGEPAWRFAADPVVLAAASPAFEALLYGPLRTKDNTIHIPDVDPRAFEVLLHYVYGRDLEIRSVPTALNSLYVAHKYLLPGLVKHCGEFLNAALQPDTVLEVYARARLFCPDGRRSPSLTNSADWQPSAPPETGDPPDPPELSAWTGNLLTQCYSYIDTHADAVLRQETFEDLPRDAIHDLLIRDSFLCRELTAFHALERWSDRECRRQAVPPTPEKRRAILGNLLFLIRFPHLSAEDFMTGPVQSELLTKTEIKFFSALLCKAPLPTVPPSLKPFLSDMSRPRFTMERPIDVKPSKTKRLSWFRSKTPKDDKPEKSEKSKCCTNVTDTLIDVMVCIFD